MARVRLSTRGRVTIPKAIRDHQRWSAGTELVIDDLDDGVVVRKAHLSSRTRARDVIGCLRYRGIPKSLHDMERAITEL